MDDEFRSYDYKLHLKRLVEADANLLDAIHSDLENFGYVHIPNVVKAPEVAEIVASFRAWQAATPQLQRLHSSISPHGIYKFAVGQQRHAWLTRTNPDVLDIFKLIYGKDLVSSMDGSCYIPGTGPRKKEASWTHTDQGPLVKGQQCLQGLVSLTANEECTFTLYRGSHLLHEPYFKDRVAECPKDPKWRKMFVLIDPEFLKTIQHTYTRVKVGAGDLILWDSRLFHQNAYGSKPEERIVQYVAFMPRGDPRNTAAMQKKRKQYFEDGRTTSHRPFPLHVNGTQPQTYGDNSKLIDYAALPPPQLEDLMPKIRTLL